MFVITGLVYGATLPQLGRGFQLASEEYLNEENTDVSLQAESVSKPFHTVAHRVPGFLLEQEGIELQLKRVSSLPRTEQSVSSSLLGIGEASANQRETETHIQEVSNRDTWELESHLPVIFHKVVSGY